MKSTHKLILMIWTTVHLDSFVDLAMLELDKAGGDGGDVALLVRESNPSSALELSLSPGFAKRGKLSGFIFFEKY